MERTTQGAQDPALMFQSPLEDGRGHFLWGHWESHACDYGEPHGWAGWRHERGVPLGSLPNQSEEAHGVQALKLGGRNLMLSVTPTKRTKMQGAGVRRPGVGHRASGVHRAESLLHPELSGPGGEGEQTRDEALLLEGAGTGSGLGCQRAFPGRPHGAPELCPGYVFL